MRYLKLLPLAALALAGCEKKAETPAAPASEEAAPAATALAPAAPAPIPTEIPTALRGRWGLVPLDCTGDPAAAKGLIAIDAKSIKFYESVAKLGKIASGGPEALDATYAFIGEGQEWTLDVALKLSDEGKTLTRKDTGKDAMPGVLKYTRCG